MSLPRRKSREESVRIKMVQNTFAQIPNQEADFNLPEDYSKQCGTTKKN